MTRRRRARSVVASPRPRSKLMRLHRVLAAHAAVLALAGVIAAAALAANPTPVTVPGDPLDPRTTVPDTKLFLHLPATGVQKYTCQANGTWLFTDPVATLYKAGGHQAVGTHFLNFATGRPMWRFKDGSFVEA